MVRALKSLVLFSEEQPATPQQNAVAMRQEKQLWVAACLSSPLAQQNLESLAAWSNDLTPLVSLVPPDSVLLEVRGSLRLFGGLKAIKQRLQEEIERRHLAFHLSTAPTFLGALWLARHRGADISMSKNLSGGLSQLPLAVTHWPDDTQALLTEMGVHNIGDCLRLPRDGFARRIGELYLNELDKALGKQACLPEAYASPQVFDWNIGLLDESEDLVVFQEALERGIEYMVRCLCRHQSQTQSLKIVFRHMNCPATVSELHLIEPSHEKHRLLGPLLARLERISLPAAVTEIGLRVDDLQAMEIEEAGLFRDQIGTGPEHVSKAILVERLRGRFGVDEVYGFELLAEYRPERAWAKLTDRLLQVSCDAGPLSPWAQDRPLWILPTPLPLADGTAKLGYRGPLQIALEPERIESGWWDGADISRDYYKAATAQGEKLWVYQDCVSSDWYLHGIFG